MSGNKFAAGLYGSLKRLVWADHFYDGDLSFLKNAEQVLEYLPVYEYMFNGNNEFYIGDLDFEDINQLEHNRSLELMQRYLKPNPYTNEEYITCSWILASDNNDNDKPHYLRKVLHVETELTDITDLGDSRNFVSAQEIIRKVAIIQQSKCYIGSQTSWENITRLYSKPVVKFWPA